jgi:hypothetical protein
VSPAAGQGEAVPASASWPGDCVSWPHGSPTDYPSIVECRQDAAPRDCSCSKSGAKWVVLNCAQVIRHTP